MAGEPRIAAYTRTYGDDDVERSAEVVAQDVRDRRRAGASTVILQPSATTTDIEAYFSFLALEVRPRIESEVDPTVSL